MTTDHDMLWHRCAHLGRIVLALVDQESWRQERRRGNLRTWGIDVTEGEQLIEVFVALTAHGVAAAASLSAEELDALPLSVVADAATSTRDIALFALLSGTCAHDCDGRIVGLLRQYAYEGGESSRRLFQLSREVRHALVTLSKRRPTP
ncbi:hypothetical protein AB0G81_39255, partial [Streptomyces asoensis]|uniref:hypothetical protein n=1 Tax=Streptomyces asoensis TaxID=249586 RepID=UPI0033F13634